MPTILASELIDKIRLAGDQQGTTLRHTDSDLMLLINDAYARYVAQGSGAGWAYWLQSRVSTMSVGRGTVDGTEVPFGIVTILSSSSSVVVESVYRFEIQLGTGEWRELEPISFSQANWGQGEWSPAANGVPQCYWAHGASDIAFTPPSDQAYSCRVWYSNAQPVPNTFDTLEVGVVGGEWWMVWDIVETLAIRDHYPEMAQLAVNKKQSVWAELVSRLAARNRDKSFRVQDTRGRRRALRYARWP